MKKNIKTMFILIIGVFFIYTPYVFAESKILNREVIQIDGETIYKRYDNLETSDVSYSGSNAGIVTISIDGEEYPAFCIEFGIAIATGTTETPTKLYDYFINVLSEEETNDLLQELTFYTRYGYGSPGRTSKKYYLATQQLIWEAINKTGFYKSDYYAKRFGKKLDFANFVWTKNRDEVLDISAEINAIKKSKSEYYKTPSFCTSQSKLELEVGTTAEFTDNNEILPLYEVTCSDGLNCQKEENKLNVTAKDETGTHKISFTKQASGGVSYLYRVSGKQGLMVDQGTLESVSCEFGIDTYKNEKTADTKIIYIVTIALFCGVMAYITYYTKKTLEGTK